VHEQSKHGGARAGSGRPKIDPAAKAEPVELSLLHHLTHWIDETPAQAESLERETGFAGGLRPPSASRAKLGREPATLTAALSSQTPRPGTGKPHNRSIAEHLDLS
jgi:hypothetical protein